MKYYQGKWTVSLLAVLSFCGCDDNSDVIIPSTGGYDSSSVVGDDPGLGVDSENDESSAPGIIDEDQEEEEVSGGDSNSDDDSNNNGEEPNVEPGNTVIGPGSKTDACTVTECADELHLSVCEDGVVSKIPCENGCLDGACIVQPEVIPECTENSCQADVLNQCVDGKVVPQKCDFGCMSGKCLPDPVVSLNGKKILFTGNSQTYYGRIILCSSGRPSWVKVDGKVAYDDSGFPVNNQGVFYYLAKSYGDEVKITNFVYGSAAIAGQRRNTSGGNSAGDCWGIDTPDKICMSSSSKYKSKMYGQLEMMKVLHPHYYNYDGKGRENMDAFYDQDYVVVQQIRNPLYKAVKTDEHLQAIKKDNPSFTDAQISNEATYLDGMAIGALFPPETGMVMMMTQWGSDAVYEEGLDRTTTKGWTLVPYGRVATKLWNNKYKDMSSFRKYKKADFLVTKDNSHPNYLVGYLGALGLYGALTNRAVVNDNFYTVEDTAAYAKNKIDRYYVRRESRAVAEKYYKNTDETNFGNMLGNDKEMTAIKRHLDEELAAYDNKLYKLKALKENSFGFVEFKRPEKMTDRSWNYDPDKSSSYSAFQWSESAETAKDWINAPRYSASGSKAPDGKYLAGFYYELPKDEIINQFKLYNPNYMIEIDGFDILTSLDGKTWEVAWSGTKLSTEMKYKKSEYTNTNYISGTFYPVKARYVMFAMTEPRPSENVDIEKYNMTYRNGSDDKKITKLSSNPHMFNITEFEVYRYTAR